jgi:transposase
MFVAMPQAIEVYGARTGEIRAAQIFVALMGASSYTSAEASWTQALPDWIGTHVGALAFMDGRERRCQAWKCPQNRV